MPQSRKVSQEPLGAGFEAAVNETLSVTPLFAQSLTRDILTRNSFLNAIAVVNVIGGSTNAVSKRKQIIVLMVAHILSRPGSAFVGHRKSGRYSSDN